MATLLQCANLFLEFDNLFKSPKIDLGKACNLGRELAAAGFADESARCLKLAVKGLHSLIQQGSMDVALNVENMIYASFVRTKETEEHYFECFSQWTSGFQQAAQKSGLGALPATCKSNALCFVLQSAVLLGHTQVMLRVIDEWRGAGIEADITVAALGAVDPAFVQQLECRNIQFIHYCGNNLAQGPAPAQAILQLRKDLATRKIGTAVWVSVPTWASYALSLPLASNQIFWSLKLHPVYLDHVRVHVCGGHEAEVYRQYNGNSWTVCPFPLTVALKDNTTEGLADIRNRFPPGAVLLGSLAREEKFNSPGFLSAVGAILSRNQQCHFLWTGRAAPPAVVEAFKLYGIEDRCHFIGWVDTNLYAEALDVFLETFPFGCGVTGFQAMGHATPLLSYKATDTLFGYQLQGGLESATLSRQQAEGLDILTAVDPFHYVELAQRLIDDVIFRQQTGEREQVYYRRECDASTRYAEKLFNLFVDQTATAKQVLVNGH